VNASAEGGDTSEPAAADTPAGASSADTPGLAALRDVTAGLAHELRNPLQFIQNYAEVVTELGDELDGILHDGTALPSQTVDDLTSLHSELSRAGEQIVRHARRLDAIVESMLATSGDTTPRRELADLNVLVRESAEFGRDGRGTASSVSGERIDFDLDDSIPLVMVDALRLSRAVVNVVTNALQAAGDDPPADAPPTVTVRTRAASDGFTITVEDNGPGIAGDSRQRVFEPFFSAKQGRAHAGLGLTQVWDIVVDDHQGRVEIDRRDDITVVSLFIPT
jgi:two-component system NtrC family sensor kinase